MSRLIILIPILLLILWVILLKRGKNSDREQVAFERKLWLSTAFIIIIGGLIMGFIILMDNTDYDGKIYQPPSINADGSVNPGKMIDD